MAAHKIDETFDAIETSVLPSLAALLDSVAETAGRSGPASFDSRSAELRDMSRQIIELTQFLAAVTAASAAQPSETIRA